LCYFFVKRESNIFLGFSSFLLLIRYLGFFALTIFLSETPKQSNDLFTLVNLEYKIDSEIALTKEERVINTTFL
jgi:hypothetical protein